MIPNIFVSSTIYDLQYLRDAIRETIMDLGYNPVMSDYGDIGYLPTKSAEDSCYATVRDCQLAIVIIGKRYGEKTKNGLSVTHNEFYEIKNRNAPIITIVDQEVIFYKRIYDANRDSEATPKFPGMDSAPDTFNFINNISDSPLNNGIISFTTATDARKNLKLQIAHLFNELLARQFNPLNIHIQDILSEVKTLRHELLKDRGKEPLKYLYAMKWLLDDRFTGNEYAKLAKAIHGSIDVAVPIILGSGSFEEFISKSNFKLIISSEFPDIIQAKAVGNLRYCSMFTIYPYSGCDEEQSGHITILNDNRLVLNNEAKNYYVHLHNDLMNTIQRQNA